MDQPFLEEEHRIWIQGENGPLAEVTFQIEGGVASIDHTFVDPSLRGQGVAGRLMEEASRVLRRRGLQIRPVCSYAVRWFEEHPQLESQTL